MNKKVSLSYRGVFYVEVILYTKECNWYTRCCPLNGGVRYYLSFQRYRISGFFSRDYISQNLLKFQFTDVIFANPTTCAMWVLY